MVKQITALATGFKGIVLEDNEAINHTHQTIFYLYLNEEWREPCSFKVN